MNAALGQVLAGNRIQIAGAPEGLDARLLAELAGARNGGVLHLARDDARMARLVQQVRFFAPALDVLTFPAWDCLPYDRVSPNVEVVSRRVDALSRLAERRRGAGRLVVATVNAAVQRVPPRGAFKDANFALVKKTRIDQSALAGFLEANGYTRAETVREPGEYAFRGGLIDLFPTGLAEPVRVDLFGDEIEGMRAFDPLTQRSARALERVELKPVGELNLTPAAIAMFRTGYRERFGAITEGDLLYQSVSEGRRQPGMEHWLPLFHERMETLFDYLPEATVTLDHQGHEVAEARFGQIAEFYESRREFMVEGKKRRDEFASGPVYKPLPPEELYIPAAAWEKVLSARAGGTFSPFEAPPGAAGTADAGGRKLPSFAEARARADDTLFASVGAAIGQHRERGRRVLVAAYSAGSADRLATLMTDHGLVAPPLAPDWPALSALGPRAAALGVLDVESGFAADDVAVLTEQDILGDRLTRAAKPKRRSDKFIAEASSMAPGDLVVHTEHGVGRYDGLMTIDVAGAPHDCLLVVYDGGDKLFVPVENIEVLSRYGTEEGPGTLDKLGGAAWQARKARVKKRILEMAEKLIGLAAERQLRTGNAMRPPEGLYGEFCARFPYPETDDQETAIADMLADIASGRPMDRLICGDVGFGKTEVALRAVFTAVNAGYQAAVVVPTTLLARQHFATFSQRFAGMPVSVAQLSRLVNAKDVAESKAALAQGKIDIVIGTHALLAKSVAFKNLGLLVVDEEQHFGVGQKERLKELRAEVHVLTLTATPIPRTLQLALAGVRDMSLIATPPVDRLAVRTFVLPFDPVVVREALMREHLRGGQSFYVCPRIEDLPRVVERLRELVPEIRVGVAHGQMTPSALEDVMGRFYDREFEVLLSTNIVESGLDIPSANTLIIHRADLFGLAQLYQLRGRIGRSKIRAYAYLTIPQGRLLRAGAERRLQVMQTLDTLGAGFTLASHDMDIRGAGNLLGEEQSGHVREVGIELYQQMLEDAVADRKSSRDAGAAPVHDWSPQITVGTPVLIPEGYVRDLGVRLGLYRRVATLNDKAEIDAFAAELVDRFGPLPEEVKNLLVIVEIKQLCYAAGVEKLDAGPKGAVVAFRQNRFTNPEGLVALIQREKGHAKLRPDHRLVFMREWHQAGKRIGGLQALARALAEIAKPKAA